MDGLTAAGALAAQPKVAEHGHEFPETQPTTAVRAMGRREKDGFARDVAMDADIVETAEQEPQHGGGGDEELRQKEFRGNDLMHAGPSFGRIRGRPGNAHAAPGRCGRPRAAFHKWRKSPPYG